MQPLIKHGTFGTHVIKNPAGTFSFAGEAPSIKETSFKTERAAWQALKTFIKGLDAEKQKELAGNMRNDFFEFFITT